MTYIPGHVAYASKAPPSMSARNFRLGQVVNYRPDVRGQNTRGKYQVIRFLPQRKDGEPEYQIRHLNEGHECVARESELRSAVGMTAV